MFGIQVMTIWKQIAFYWVKTVDRRAGEDVASILYWVELQEFI